MKNRLITPTTRDIEALGNNAATLMLPSHHSGVPRSIKPSALGKKPQVKIPKPPPVRGRKRSLTQATPRSPSPQQPLNNATKNNLVKNNLERSSLTKNSAAKNSFDPAPVPTGQMDQLLKFDSKANREEINYEFGEETWESTGERLVRRMSGWFGLRKKRSQE